MVLAEALTKKTFPPALMHQWIVAAEKFMPDDMAQEVMAAVRGGGPLSGKLMLKATRAISNTSADASKTSADASQTSADASMTNASADEIQDAEWQRCS